MATIKITDASFDADVLNSGKPVLLDFWAEWCGPCRMIGPALEELSVERDDVIIAKINIDENPETPTRFGVRSIPTLMIFKGGEVSAMKLGAMPKAALAQWIDQSL